MQCRWTWRWGSLEGRTGLPAEVSKAPSLSEETDTLSPTDAASSPSFPLTLVSLLVDFQPLSVTFESWSYLRGGCAVRTLESEEPYFCFVGKLVSRDPHVSEIGKEDSGEPASVPGNRPSGGVVSTLLHPPSEDGEHLSLHAVIIHPSSPRGHTRGR